MKSLYNEYGAAVSDDADELRHIADAFLTSAMKRFSDRGYSLREISHFLANHLSCVEAEMVLTKATQRRALDKLMDTVV